MFNGFNKLKYITAKKQLHFLPQLAKSIDSTTCISKLDFAKFEGPKSPNYEVQMLTYEKFKTLINDQEYESVVLKLRFAQVS